MAILAICGHRKGQRGVYSSLCYVRGGWCSFAVILRVLGLLIKNNLIEYAQRDKNLKTQFSRGIIRNMWQVYSFLKKSINKYEWSFGGLRYREWVGYDQDGAFCVRNTDSNEENIKTNNSDMVMVILIKMRPTFTWAFQSVCMCAYDIYMCTCVWMWTLSCMCSGGQGSLSLSTLLFEAVSSLCLSGAYYFS